MPSRLPECNQLTRVMLPKSTAFLRDLQAVVILQDVWLHHLSSYSHIHICEKLYLYL